MIPIIVRVATAVVVSTGIVFAASNRSAATTRGLTAITGVSVGHHTLEARLTGCTVILTEDGAVAAVDIRGPAPGTRETALLDPTNVRVQRVHAIVLTGGSAFGLAVADGVIRYLDERGVGFETPSARVPIVPAAVLYDLGIGDPTIRPTAECGYRAAKAARTDLIEEGNVGAGAGATVGKLAGAARAMKGGIGTALVELPGGVKVAALIAVNAVGDIHDPNTGAIIAGARTEDGRRFIGTRNLLRESEYSETRGGTNTTIGVVMTNVVLDPAQLGVVARMAQSGLARTVRPAHTPADGDTIFALSTGTLRNDAGLLRIGAFAADVTADAIVRAVKAATSIPGYPASRDLKESTR